MSILSASEADFRQEDSDSCARVILSDSRHNLGMELRIKELRKRAGLTLEQLCERVGINNSHLSRMENGKSAPSLAVLDKIATSLGVDITDLFLRDAVIHIVGLVGAGAQISLVDAFEKHDGLYKIACPEGLDPSSVVAVEVSGDSMYPVYDDGDIIVFTRQFMYIDAMDIGRNVVCEDVEGNVWVKRLHMGRSPNTFTLFSINPARPPMENVRLSWAARVRRHIPKDDANVIGDWPRQQRVTSFS